MDAAQVEALRALLAPSGWLDRTRHFARALHGRARTRSGLLIVGTPAEEPWHMTAHLADESRLAGVPELAPTLIRWSPPPGAAPHLSVGIQRLEQAGSAETVLVVSSDAAPAALLERVADARKAGTAIFALDRGDPELDGLAHEALMVRPIVDPVSFDGAQHLVSVSVGEALVDGGGGRWLAAASADGDPRAGGTRSGRLGVRSRLARLLDAVSGPQSD